MHAKVVEDNNKQTGRARKLWKYHDDMMEWWDRVQRQTQDSPLILLPLVKVTGTSQSNSDDGSQTQDQSDESGDEFWEGGQRRKKKAKLPTRKSKSNSSAAKMLQFLHSNSEKKEKADAEKLALLKSVKDEKKRILHVFTIPWFA